jgi:hypothetical protein
MASIPISCNTDADYAVRFGSTSPQIVMRFLALLAFASANTLAFAQDVQPGDVVALSTFSPAGAQHGTLAAAINEAGDAFLVWEAAVDAPGSAGEGLTRIESAFLRRISGETWRVFPTEILGEADPAALGANQVYAGGDTCSAPSVAAVGNDFVVAWTRSDLSNSGEIWIGSNVGQIECVSVEVPTVGGTTVSSAAPGVGHLVTAMNPLGAAGQPDILHTTGTDFLICYVNYLSGWNHADGQSYTFELAAIQGSLGIAGPSFGAPVVLDDLVEYDDLPANTSQPAAVEPSCALDSFGNLVVAYSKYRSIGRWAASGRSFGWLTLARFSVGSFSALNEQIIDVRGNGNFHHSADLNRSKSNSQISLTVTDVDVLGNDTNQIGHYDLDFSSPAADATITDFNVGKKNWQPIQAEALQQHGLRVALTDLDFFGTAAVAFKRPNKPWSEVNRLRSIAPQGLTLGHLETDPLDVNRGWAILLVRGTAGSDDRAHFMMARL